MSLSLRWAKGVPFPYRDPVFSTSNLVLGVVVVLAWVLQSNSPQTCRFATLLGSVSQIYAGLDLVFVSLFQTSNRPVKLPMTTFWAEFQKSGGITTYPNRSFIPRDSASTALAITRQLRKNSIWNERKTHSLHIVIVVVVVGGIFPSWLVFFNNFFLLFFNHIFKYKYNIISCFVWFS